MPVVMSVFPAVTSSNVCNENCLLHCSLLLKQLNDCQLQMLKFSMFPDTLCAPNTVFFWYEGKTVRHIHRSATSQDEWITLTVTMAPVLWWDILGKMWTVSKDVNIYVSLTLWWFYGWIRVAQNCRPCVRCLRKECWPMWFDPIAEL